MSSWQEVVFIPVTASVLAILFLLLAGDHLPAFAQGSACAEDMQKLCKDAPRARGGVMKCLRDHQAQLSPACQDEIQAARTQGQEVSQACQSDVQQFCQDVKPARGGLAKCLKTHESELSPACKDALAHAGSTRRRTP